MSPIQVDKLILAIAAVVSAVGAVDAAVGGQADLVAVFLLTGTLQAALLVRLQADRPAVPLRGDLVRWLQDRAAAEGEPVGAVADRCVAACRRWT